MNSKGCVSLFAVRHGIDAFFVGNTQTEHLEAAAVSEGWTAVIHKLPKPAGLRHDISPGSKHQVVGISKDRLSAIGDYLLGGECFNCGLGSTHDEGRRLDIAMRRADNSRARKCTRQSIGNFKFDADDLSIFACKSDRNFDRQVFSLSIAVESFLSRLAI